MAAKKRHVGHKSHIALPVTNDVAAPIMAIRPGIRPSAAALASPLLWGHSASRIRGPWPAVAAAEINPTLGTEGKAAGQIWPMKLG